MIYEIGFEFRTSNIPIVPIFRTFTLYDKATGEPQMRVAYVAWLCLGAWVAATEDPPDEEHQED